jgi:dihydroflavonol-4-reductase
MPLKKTWVGRGIKVVQVLVTGGTGLIGSHLIRELLRTGYRVRTLVRPGSDLRALAGLPVEYAVGDVLELASLTAAAEGCVWFFHAATPFRYERDSAQAQTTIAVEGVRNALLACRTRAVKRLILTSSSVVCGSSSRLQTRTETHTLQEADPPLYIRAKAQQEAVALALAKELDLELVSVCPTLCVGAYDYRLGPSNGAIVQYLNDPFHSTFPGGANIVSARDVAVGHRLAAEYGSAGERYLLGSQNMEWSMIHRLISELCGLPGPQVYANHTASYLSAVAQELAQVYWRIPARVTREQVKMVGRFYWYAHDKAAQLGYHPMDARTALAQTIGWLMTSPHLPAGLRAMMKPEPEVLGSYQEHRQQGTGYLNTPP